MAPSTNATTVTNTPTISPTKYPTMKLDICCSCNVNTDDPGCPDDTKCQQIICNEDTYCCDTQWDETCAFIAQNICDNGTSPPTNAPTQSPTDTPSRSPTIFGETLNPTVDPTQSPSLDPTTSEPTTGHPTSTQHQV